MQRKKLLVVVLALSLLILVPAVVSPAVVNLSDSLFSSRSAAIEQSSSLGLFVSPNHILDETLQSGSTFNVTVNVSNVTELFSWQVGMVWNSSLLNVSRIFAGEFLSRTLSLNKTSSASPYYGGLGYVINIVNNTVGNVTLAESILEDAALGSVPGITGSGVLVTVEFLVTGYGCTGLNVSLTGNLRTMLLDSTGAEISLAPVDVQSGYFRNKLTGDANGDRAVNVFDVLKVKYHRSGPPPGPGGYERNVDINDDGFINVFDILIVKANLGRSI